MSEFLGDHEIRVGLHTELDRQVSNYIVHGYDLFLHESAEVFTARFDRLREALMNVSYRMPSDLPVLAVVPESMISLEDQLALSGNRAFLKSSEMRSVRTWPTEPKEPYALLDISYGYSLRQFSAEEAQKELLVVGRTGLRLVELLDLGIHERGAFQDVRGLYAVETRHQLEGFDETIVDLYRYGESLKVKRDPGNINDPDWTTPSYASTLVIS